MLITSNWLLISFGNILLHPHCHIKVIYLFCDIFINISNYTSYSRYSKGIWLFKQLYLSLLDVANSSKVLMCATEQSLARVLGRGSGMVEGNLAPMSGNRLENNMVKPRQYLFKSGTSVHTLWHDNSYSAYATHVKCFKMKFVISPSCTHCHDHCKRSIMSFFGTMFFHCCHSY